MKLDLTPNKNFMRKNPWPFWKKQCLIKAYPYFSNKDLAVYFTTTVKSIESIAVRNKLKKAKGIIGNNIAKGRIIANKENEKIGKIYSSKRYDYVYMPMHPRANKNGFVHEHIVVMEKKINRFLKNDEKVFHKNNNPKDNRIENLFIKKVILLKNINVEELVNLRKNGKTIEELKALFNLNNATLYKLLRSSKENVINVPKYNNKTLICKEKKARKK